MQLKMIGVICVIVSCGGWGILAAAKYRLKIWTIQELVNALNYMISELQYRGTPLPQLCQMAAERCQGKTKTVLLALAKELYAQISPDAQRCMAVVLDRYCDVPFEYCQILRDLGNSLGKFNLPGQIQAFESAKVHAVELLKELRENKDTRLRSYQTLGLCAGAAIAILLV